MSYLLQMFRNLKYIKYLKLFSNDAEISNVTCSVMSAIFNNLSDEESLEFILEQYWDVADDLGLPKEEEKVYITYAGKDRKAKDGGRN